MSLSTDELATLDGQVERMVTLIDKIRSGKTNIEAIDSIKSKRYEAARDQIGKDADTIDFGTTKPYVIKFISLLSEHGGLIKYVAGKDFEKPLVREDESIEHTTQKDSRQLKEELIESFRRQGVSEHEIKYITSVSAYIDARMAEYEHDDEPKTIKWHQEKMDTIIKDIRSGKTYLNDIDGIVEKRYEAARDEVGRDAMRIAADTTDFGRTPPYVINCISFLSKYGGLIHDSCERVPDRETPRETRIAASKRINPLAALKNALSRGIKAIQVKLARNNEQDRKSNVQGNSDKEEEEK